MIQLKRDKKNQSKPPTPTSSPSPRPSTGTPPRNAPEPHDVLVELREPGKPVDGLTVPLVYVESKRRYVSGTAELRKLPSIHRRVIRLKSARQMDSHGLAGAAAIGLVASEPVSSLAPSAGYPTGKGVVLGIIDNGCPFLHRNFLRKVNKNLETRVESLWDQSKTHRTGPGWLSKLGFDYGVELTSKEINRRITENTRNSVLDADTVYDELGYLEFVSRPVSHGMQVMDIAGGKKAEGSIAPDSDIVFVQLKPIDGRPGFVNANSRFILDALMYIDAVAGKRPASICLCYSPDTGPHDGSSILECAIDEFLDPAKKQRGHGSRMLVMSAGNNYQRKNHAAMVVAPGKSETLDWNIVAGDTTWNYMNLWYPRTRELVISLTPPGGKTVGPIKLGEMTGVRIGGDLVGEVVHRQGTLKKSNDNEALIALHPAFKPDMPHAPAGRSATFRDVVAPAGKWRVELEAIGAEAVPVHAWIERDDASPTRTREQSSFDFPDLDPDLEAASPPDIHRRCTLSGGVTGKRPLVVGAFNTATDGICSFSAAGPTRDGRYDKPDLCAPGASDPDEKGVMVTETRSSNMSRAAGTSMAAASAAGAVALLLEAAEKHGMSLTAEEIRDILRSTARPLRKPGTSPLRSGQGALDIGAALRLLELRATHRG